MAGTRPRNVRVPVELRERVRDMCEDAEGVTATAIVVRGLRDFAEDRAEVGQVVEWAAANPPGGETVQLSYRVPDDVWDAALGRCDALERYGLEQGVVLSGSLVAVHALAEAVAEAGIREG